VYPIQTQKTLGALRAFAVQSFSDVTENQIMTSLTVDNMKRTLTPLFEKQGVLKAVVFRWLRAAYIDEDAEMCINHAEKIIETVRSVLKL
jgi:hypothetical protein